MNPVPGEGKPRGICIFGNNPELEIIMPKRDLSAYLIGLSQVFMKSSIFCCPSAPLSCPLCVMETLEYLGLGIPQRSVILCVVIACVVILGRRALLWPRGQEAASITFLKAELSC